MIDPIYEADDAEAAALTQAGLNAICEWLDAPPLLQTTEELSPLRTHLAALRDMPATTDQRTAVLEQLFIRTMLLVDKFLPELVDIALPIPRKTRHVVRGLQDLLQTLATDLVSSVAQESELDEDLICGLRHTPELTLWRSLQALAHHLLISDLVAAPARVGIWEQLHGTFSIASRLQIADKVPEGTHASLQQIYHAALLLGCAQPASFTSREIAFVADYLKHFANHAEMGFKDMPESPGTFWVHSRHDTAPYACSRKTAPLDPDVVFLSCDRLAVLLAKQLDALNSGSTPQQINLPDFVETPAGRGVLRRLANYWGHPGKRRFPRRRQNYRAALCCGLDCLWHLFQDDDHATTADLSHWMITNESPDGYAIMHVSGKTGKLRVGDITAIRTESGNDWQICLVRWALSENPEHLELGLQILAARAVPAILALPPKSRNNVHSHGRLLPVLILPEVPMLRPTETLIAPSGELADHHDRFTLVIEQENIEVREVTTTQLDEQTDSIAVFSIQPADQPVIA